MSHTLPSRRIPNLRHHKPRDLAVVRINGRDHYLGPYGTPAATAKYHRLVFGMGPERTATKMETRRVSEAALTPTITLADASSFH